MTYDDTGEHRRGSSTIAVLYEKVTRLGEDLEDLEGGLNSRLNDCVTRREFELVQKVVWGLVSLIVAAVIWKILASVGLK